LFVSRDQVDPIALDRPTVETNCGIILKTSA
jgi:hypothetical protein